MHKSKTTSCNIKNNFKRILTFTAIYAFLAQPLLASSNSVVSAQPLYAPTPTVSLDVDSQVLIGEDFRFTVTFDNSSTDIGYGPYIDVYLPQSGADDSTDGLKQDGITYTNVDYLGNYIRTWEYECVEGDSITHPLTGLSVTCPAAPTGAYSPFTWQLLVIELPFGSFVNGQPEVVVDIDANLSDYADTDVDLPILAQSGFRFGADALDNPSTDPPIIGAQVSSSVTPSLLILKKEYNWRESETSTGPNYLRRYTISVDIPADQTLTNLEVVDDIPDNMQFVEVLSTDPAGAVCTTPATTDPNGTLSCVFDTVTGTASAADATVTFSFYIPLDDLADERVIAAESGGCVYSENPVSASAMWDPYDPRDDSQLTTASKDPAHTLEDCSHTIQKFSEIAVDASPAKLSPGDVIEYRLEFQVSDYFAYDDFTVTDVISDGQRLLDTFTPTLSFEGNGYSLAAADFDAANYTIDSDYTPISTAPNTGTTTVTFNISDELVTRGEANGYLIGGCVPTGGTGGTDPDCDSYNDGATLGVITFRTTVQEEFSDDYPSGDPSVDQGDKLTNDVTADGTVLNNADLSATASIPSEDSGVTLTLDHGTLTKSIYAVNGSTTLTNPVTLSPQNTITFRFQYELPTSDVEDLEFTDFLPLPVLDSDEITTFDDVLDSTIPAAGHIKFGPADTFRNYSGIVPSISVNSADNSFTLTYGNFDSTDNTPTLIDIFFTVTVSNDPFADELYLTNEIYAYEGSTNFSVSSSTSIIRFVLYEPELTSGKGAVASDRADAVYDPDSVAPLTFSDPGGTCPRFGGVIDSASLADAPIASDISGVDYGDVVTFVLVIENSGHSAAYDVQVQDILPSGFTTPTGGLNICVTDGSGNLLDYTDLGGGLFSSGIELVDPSGGALASAYDSSGNLITDGSNLAVITVDLLVDSSVTPEQVLTNSSVILNFAGVEGGTDYSTENPSDSSDTEIAPPVIEKDVLATNQSQTSGTDVVIGETATYTITITVPEGSTPNAYVNETIPEGATFADCLSIVSSSASLTTDLAGGFDDACNDPTNPEITSDGHGVSFSLGNLTNADTDNATVETLTIEFTTVALNVSANQQGSTIANTAYFSWDTGIINDSAPELTVVEPALSNAKDVTPVRGDAGDEITFTIAISNPAAGTDAYDVTLDDIVPSGMTFQTGSFTLVSGLSPDTVGESPDLYATWATFPAGSTSTFSFTATLDTSVTPADRITNDAILKFTSLPGEPGQQSDYNALSYERTGDVTDPGGSANDYLVTDSAYVDITIPTPLKYLINTSEPDTYTSGNTVAIGEIARYRLATILPEGTSVGFQIRDLLPAGLLYLDDGTARLAFISNGTGISSSTITCTNDNGSAADTASLDTSLVDCTFPAGSITNGGTANAFTSGNDPWFELGNLLNEDSDSDNEYVVVEFNALAVNVSGNQAGTALTNDFRAYEGGTQAADANNLTVRVVEPQVTVAKTVSAGPYEAGDPLTYTIVVSNASSTYSTAAFDLKLSDVFDASLSVLSHSLDVVPAYATATDNSSGNTIDVSQDRLDPGDNLTVTVQVNVLDTAAAGLDIPNQANVSYTSLTGTNGTTSNDTGSSNTGTPGTTSGERTGADGSGGLNDYVSADSADIQTGTPSVDKQAPSPIVYTIGETVVYPILVTLPDGITQGLQITDNIPDGLEYVSYQVIGTAAASSGLLAQDFSGSALSPTPSTAGGSGADLVLAFGDVTATADTTEPEPDNNTFLIYVTLRVMDLPANADGVTLENYATLAYTDPNDLTTKTLTDGPETISLVEPDPQISKVFNPDEVAINETTQITLVVTNNGTSPAYDVVVEDAFPLATFQSLTEVTTPADFTYSENVTASDRVVTFTGGPIEVGGTRTFIFNATVGDTFASGETFLNTAVVSQVTTLSGASDYERDEPDVQATDTLTGISPDLTLTKDDGVTVVTPGSTLVYVLTIDNVGAHDSGAITLSDTVPTGTVFDSANSTPGWSCSDGDPVGSVCTLSLSALTSSGETSAAFAVRVDDPAAADLTEIVNSASVTDDGTYGVDPTPENNSDDDTDVLTSAAPDLTVSKVDSFLLDADDSGLPSPGDTLHYVVSIANNGNQNLGSAVFSDTPDSNTTLVAGSVTTTLGSVTLGNTLGDTSISVALGDLSGEGGAATIEFNVTINDPLVPDTTSYVENQGLLAGDNAADVPSDDPDLPGDEDPTVTLLDSAFIKAVASTNMDYTADPNVTIGELVEYQVTILVPPGIAENAVLTDTLEAGLAFNDCLSITPASADLTTDVLDGFDGACTNAVIAAEPDGDLEEVNQGRKITYDLGNLTNTSTESVALQINYQVVVLDSDINLAGEQRSNLIDWSYGGSTLETSAEPVTIVVPQMTVIKSVNDTSVAAGQVVTFTLRISHSDSSGVNAYNLVLTDPLPEYLVYIEDSLEQISGTAATALDDSDPTSLVMSWDEFPLDGEEAVIQFKARVSGLSAGHSTTNDVALTWTTLPEEVGSAQSIYNTLSIERTNDQDSDVDLVRALSSSGTTLIYPSPTAVPTVRPTPTFPASK
jgi:uncharacterized repeat protein (TIGR01451 family)/fimbrial isopeptide formation D2 family protein